MLLKLLTRVFTSMALITVMYPLQMAWDISHDLATFLDYGLKLMERLKTEGDRLSEIEIRILRAQLNKLSIAADHLNDIKWRDRSEEAA